MPVTQSKGAYEDCYALFDRALASPNGIRIRFDERGPAYYLRLRLNYARTLSRDESRLTEEPESPAYGTSPYDVLTIMVREINDEFIVIVRRRVIGGEIEEIEAAE